MNVKAKITLDPRLCDGTPFCCTICTLNSCAISEWIGKTQDALLGEGKVEMY